MKFPKSVRNKLSVEDRMFYGSISAVLLLLLVIVAIPMLNIIASSFSSGNAVTTGKVFIWPVEFSLEGYRAVFKNSAILTGYFNTIFYTFFATSLDIIMTLLVAYPLSRKGLPWGNKLTLLFTFTMIFSGGLIPTYILMRNLGLINNRLVMIIPGAISVYNMIITRTYFQTNIPKELLEASQMDGCSDFRFFRSIVLPLSKPIIAVITLFYAVGHWNAFFNAFIYLNDKSLYPLQIVLRDILVANTIDSSMMVDPELFVEKMNLADLLKYSLIIVASLPVWCMYPFVQKHFVKGVMLGSIKG